MLQTQREISLLCKMTFQLLFCLYTLNSQVTSELLLPGWLLPTVRRQFISFSWVWSVVRTEFCPASSSHATPLAGLSWTLYSSPIFQCSAGLHFMCHFYKYSLYSSIQKSNSKNSSLPCRTTLDIALPFDRELLINAFQLPFSAGLHPFHLHHAFLACLSESHIKRIRKVKLRHLLFPSFQGLLSCQRGRLDWLTVYVHDKSMLTFSNLFLFLPVLKAVRSSIFIFFFQELISGKRSMNITLGSYLLKMGSMMPLLFSEISNVLQNLSKTTAKASHFIRTVLGILGLHQPKQTQKYIESQNH